MNIDEYTLPDHINPARWPFDHQRARERAALVAFPNPPSSNETRLRRRRWKTQRELAEERRRTRRESAAG